MRKVIIPHSIALTYLLGDHLGSTSLAVDSVDTTNVIETRYKPWGEVRFTTEDLTLPTRYTFTGQYSYVSDSATDLAASASFGLMFYNARWYDPALGRFAQADTIVPGGVQGLDRYAYVGNNPVRYVDPSGHIQCENFDNEGNCLDPIGLEGLLLHEFGWILEGDDWDGTYWETSKYMRRLLLTARDIRKYVDSKVPGKGQAWMDRWFGGLTFVIIHGNVPSQTNGTRVEMSFLTLECGNTLAAKIEIAHELGHVWDYRTGKNSFTGGAGDQLNTRIGGNVAGLSLDERVENPRDPSFFSPYIPEEAGWSGDYWYGNGDPTEYLAEAFTYSIYKPEVVPQIASQVIPYWIVMQAYTWP
jgi:RHS repeat-associated protein